MPVTVLVVEDDFLIADDYAATFEEKGWHVLGPAATAEDALRLLQDESPTVAVLDLMLRRELSTAVAQDLLIRRIPFVVASGCPDPAAVGGDVFQGIVNLRKPTTPQGLITALEHAMASST